MPAQRVSRPVLAALGACAVLAAPSSAAAAECAGQELVPAPENLAQVEAATLCLANAERSARGLPGLRANARLRNAAVKHSRDMVAQGYFSHDSLDGSDFTDRIDAAGYIPSRGRYLVGENIGWGGGELASPKVMVEGWMSSPSHRANLLHRGFREIGIGIAVGAPTSTPFPGATYTTDFGARPDRKAQSRRARANKRKREAAKRRRAKRRKSSRRSRVIAHIRWVRPFN